MSLSSINHTHIILILKVNNPKYVTHFCLISLCNVIFKISSKMIMNRFQEVIHICINEAYNTFVSSRLILDNVVAAYEMFHSLKGKMVGMRGYFALKLDMSKTYDRVE